MQSDILVTCCFCGTSFFRASKEVKRNIKLGRKIYCNNSCSAKDKPEFKNNWDNPELIEKYLKPNWRGRQIDEFSPFRYFISKAKSRIKFDPTDLDVEYLKDLWNKQKGICPYTNILMELPLTTSSHHIKAENPCKASLDRIDSSKGYIKGNVEFVCLGVNLAKSQFSSKIMHDFIAKIRNN